MSLDRLRRRAEAKALAEATLRALNLPGGQAILDRMISGAITIPEGLAQLAVLSDEYAWKEDRP